MPSFFPLCPPPPKMFSHQRLQLIPPTNALTLQPAKVVITQNLSIKEMVILSFRQNNNQPMSIISILEHFLRKSWISNSQTETYLHELRKFLSYNHTFTKLPGRGSLLPENKSNNNSSQKNYVGSKRSDYQYWVYSPSIDDKKLYIGSAGSIGSGIVVSSVERNSRKRIVEDSNEGSAKKFRLTDVD
ncbi:hypothetical protein HK098_007697 [Nowakowskiella sp. JEL0407]|nr:hypothetical protein HK098_007697 [Nowakowskiella sp. JEL0407]